MATPHEYFLSVIGKGFDEDGVYGVQCVDGFKHFCRTVVGYNISHTTICDPSGLAYSIWDNFESLGLNKYFTITGYTSNADKVFITESFKCK